MKKRLLCLILTAILALASIFSLAACSDSGGSGKKTDEYATPDFVPSDYPKDDAFKGAVSKESYTSTENAAKAFLQNEIAGDASNTTFKEYSKKADLTDKELADLSYATEGLNVTSAERGEISYEDNTASASARNAKAGTSAPGGSLTTVKVKTATVYIFVIDFSNYKYFAPELNKGDVITQSYYDEIFDQAKYANCTVNENATATVSYTAQGQKIKTESVSDSTVYLTEQYCYCSAKVTVKAYLGTSLMQSEETLAEIFYVFDGNGAIAEMYVRSDNSPWVETSMTTIDIRDYTTPKMDNSFFVKADYGFTVNREKFSLFIQEAVNNVANNNGMQFNMDNLTGSYDFMVKNGKLDKAVLTLKGTVSTGGQSGQFDQNATTTYTKFGTTTVRVPDGIILDNPPEIEE